LALSKVKLKLIRSLHQTRGRKETGLFLVEGPELIKEALKEDWPLNEIIASHIFSSEKSGIGLKKLADLAEISITICTNQDLERISDTKTPQGAIAIANCSGKVNNREVIKNPDLLLFCEQISDPGNLGTLIRTADWFGIPRIILGEGSTDPFSPKVVRSSAGSIFRVRIEIVRNFQAVLEKEAESGRKLYAATLKGELTPANLPNRGLRGLVIGHEKRGVSNKIAAICTSSVTIPRKGRAESLNLAVAAGIILSNLS
jgi:TrmH family RNA methyltransferase